ncbi:hypothetical protein [Enterocloster clostridioformis]|uniref:Uncharacterized protein n=1 Tax=[Clostridium] clostridioforme 90A8 TaxID=999408 RepID=A0A0E2H8Q4_9FIRM|nr:hypothetical protein [Enterocloster clostridioformis]ENZ12479.1 hypothetical protein HMPREF1090_03610 [[Clostridium] clostridioforme 90A8]
MIRHETYSFDQCKVTFNKDIYSAILERREGKEEQYPTVLLDYRPIGEDRVDLRTIPCILEFKNEKAIDDLIRVLKHLKESWKEAGETNG